ncbi:MAG: C25 family cysteine peptidase [Bacteroidales bacterium]
MNKIIIHIFIISTIVFCYNGNAQNSKANQINFNYSLEGISIFTELPQLEIEELKIEDYDFINLRISNEFGLNNKLASPSLPVYYRIIEIPIGVEPRIIIRNQRTNEIEFDNKKIYPYQGSKPKTNPDNNFIMDKEIYSRDEFYSQDLVSIENLGIMGSSQLARIAISPIRYNPIRNLIEYTYSMDVEIVFEGFDLDKTLEVKSKYYNLSQEFLKNKLGVGIDYMLGNNTIINRPRKMIILTDSIFSQTLQPFIQWKRELGIEVIEVYRGVGAVGTTNQSIRNYLKSLWENSSLNNPSADYLLICGDIGQVPCFYGNTDSQTPTDLYYAEYTDDYLPELFYGRFPANTPEQMQAIVQKTIEYEKYNFVDETYLNKTLLVAGKETMALAQTCNNGQMNYLKNNYLSQISNLDTLVYYNPSSANYATQIRDSISKNGYSLINYSAHCDENGWSQPNYTVFNVKNNINNTNKYSFYINNCCLSSKFDEAECFGESLIRAENKGGIGVIGGSNLTYWYEDYYWSVGAKSPSLNSPYDSTKLGTYDRWLHLNNEKRSLWTISQGEIVQGGNLAVSQMNSEKTNYYWEIYHLFGDPSLMPYLGVPQNNYNNLPSTIAKGENHLSFTTNSYSFVGVSKNGVLLGASQADSNGNVDISFPNPILDSGYVKVVISNQFYKPFIDSLEIIIPNTPSINISSLKLFDSLDNEVTEIKNNQTYKLWIDLMNLSSLDLDSVTISIKNNQLINSIDSSFYIGAMLNQSPYLINKLLSFRTSDGIRDGEILNLELKIKSQDNYTNERIFKFRINSPEIKLENLNISNGNGGNVFNIGDTIILSIDIKNLGHNNSNFGYGKLNQLSQNLELIEDSIINFSPIDYNSSYRLEYKLRIIDSSSLEFRIGAWAGNYYDVKLYSINTLNNGIEGFETNNFSFLNWENNSSKPWVIDSASSNVYMGNYSARSGKIYDNQKSTLVLKSKIIANDSISFFVKHSTEKDYDFFRFYIDNNVVGEYSGSLNWTKLSFPISEGEHEFRWEYEKDYSTSFGLDGVWIDNIKLPLSGTITSIENRIENTNKEEEFSVIIYPNPSHGEIIINSGFEKFDLKIIDNSGRIVMQMKNIVNNQRIDLSSLNSGTYFIITNSKGKNISKKLIITK